MIGVHPARIVVLAVAALTVAGCETTKRAGPAPIPLPAIETPPPLAIPPLPRPPPPAPPPPQVRSCVPRNLPPAPRYPDTDAALRAAPGAADRYRLLAAGRLLRQKRLEDLERVIQNCR